MEIQTKRLRLIALDLKSLQFWKQSREEMEHHLGLKPSNLTLSDGFEKEILEAIDWWINFAKENPDESYWGTNWEVVHKEENRSIGTIAFGELPEEKGKYLTGYSIDVRYQRKGYASEALQGILSWAFKDPRVKTFVGITPKTNLASQGVLSNNGFEKRKEVEDHGMECFLWELDKNVE